MAHGAGQIASGAWALAAGLGALTLGTAAIVMARGGVMALGEADLAALRFTVWQAILSAGMSVGLAIPVARAFARRRFFGREALISLMGAPFLLPVLVAVMGLLALFGRSGWLAQLAARVGVELPPIYGIGGVVMAHVFLNLPLAVRMLLQGWQAIPAERLRLAESLSFGPAAYARHIERPMLRDVAPGALALIFAICLTSFAVALTLGGGPKASTIELMIYQYLRFDFDPGRAAGLGALQFLLGAVAALLAWTMSRPIGLGRGVIAGTPRLRGPQGWRRALDGFWLVAAMLFLLAPLIAAVASGIEGLPEVPWVVVGWAALRSVTVAVIAAMLSTAGALTLALAVARGARGRWVLDGVANLPLASSALVIGTGLFLAIQPYVPPARLALPITVLVNAALAMPFVYRIILPETRSLLADYGHLMAQLRLKGRTALRWVILPRLARPLGLGAGVAAALSAGDLGVITLFAGDGQATLPMVIQRLMAAYRMPAAAGASLVLIVLAYGLFAAFDRWGQHHAER